MMHKAWSGIEEVSYCFSRSAIKMQGHTAKKNRRFRPKLGVSGPIYFILFIFYFILFLFILLILFIHLIVK